MVRTKKIKCDDKPLITFEELKSLGDNYINIGGEISKLSLTNRIHFIKENLKFGYDNDLNDNIKFAIICMSNLLKI